jgi:hypothetical protein
MCRAATSWRDGSTTKACGPARAHEIFPSFLILMCRAATSWPDGSTTRPAARHEAHEIFPSFLIFMCALDVVARRFNHEGLRPGTKHSKSSSRFVIFYVAVARQAPSDIICHTWTRR